MEAERFRRVGEQFSRLVGMEPREREAALRCLEAAEPEVAREVASLLERDGRIGDFLGTPALGARVDVWAAGAAGLREEDLSGAVVGHYRLVRRIASGGMGTVYLAERADGQFEQRVAIKLIKRGLDTDEVLRRFRHERSTLAALNHPCIAGLLDGGATESGRPYLVMEYVRGEPIDVSCRRRGLSREQRVRLFMQVCDAVHYAHQNLVVHRDIKPQNVLVTEEGLPKLVDFGVAKVLGEPGQAGLTLEAGSRFTPEYASPEQVLGQAVTTATDIYSLGVLLYELIADRPPYTFRMRTEAEVRTVVCEQDPPPPSAAGEQPVGRISGDLDRIVLMAMRKEPARRYASAEQLSADLARYLEGRPVMARPNTLGYVAAKFVRRNKLAVGAAAVILLSVVGGTAGVVWQGREAARQRDLAILHRAESEAITRFLREMLSGADPGNAGPDLTVREFLDTSAERAQQELRDRPLVRAEVLGTIARTYMNLGVLDKAEPLLEETLALREGESRTHAQQLVETLVDMGTLRYLQQRFEEAEAPLRRAVAVARERLGPRHATLGMALNSLGPVLRRQGKTDEAAAALEEALAVRRAALGPDHEDVAETLNNLSFIAYQRGDLPGAEALLREALRIRRARLDPGHPMLVQAMDNLAVILQRQNKPAEALPLQEEAVAMARQRYTAEHPTLAVHLHNYGSSLVAVERWAEAEPVLREAVEIRTRLLGETDPRTVSTLCTLATAVEKQGRTDEAERSVLQMWEKVRDAPGTPARESARAWLQKHYADRGDQQRAGQFAAPPPAGPG